MHLRVLFLLILFSCSPTEEIDEKALTLRLKEEEVYLVDNHVSFTLELANNTDSAFHLFAFKMIHESLSKETVYYESLNYPSGTGVFITDSEGNIANWDDPDPRYVDFNDIRDMKVRTDEAYINKMVHLRSGESITAELKLELKHFRLEKGTYDFFVVHYSGENLHVFIPEETQEKYEDELQSLTFQGWVRSNTIKLIVE